MWKLSRAQIVQIGEIAINTNQTDSYDQWLKEFISNVEYHLSIRIDN